MKYHYRLRKLISKKSKIKRHYDSNVEETKIDEYEKDSRDADAIACIELIDQSISELQTSYLLDKAKWLMVPLPVYKDGSC